MTHLAFVGNCGLVCLVVSKNFEPFFGNNLLVDLCTNFVALSFFLR